MKKNNKKGFTLAELLIVVAIIAVLVAVAIPVFTAQLEKSREATDLANVRSAYAELMTEYLDWDGTSTIADKKVAAKQAQSGWQGGTSTIADGIAVTNHTVGENYTVKINTSTGVITVE